MSERPVMILAGGTGGHIFPALAVAEVLQERGVPVVWMGTRAGLEARVIPAAGIPIEWLDVQGLRRKGLGGWVRAPFMLMRSTAQAVAAMRRHRPRAVLGMGGYVTGPGALACRLLGVPLLLHEQNAIAGFTNRKLMRFAQRVMTGFDGVFAGAKVETTGNPVRRAIAALPEPAARRRPGQRLRLLVLGGSQGAAALNDTVPAALAQLERALKPEVWHQAGVRGLEDAKHAYRQHGLDDARVTAFIDDMAQAYAWADLAIARAGALTVAELSSAGVPAILVPYPFAVDDHQTANARALVERDAAVLMPQDHLTPERLANVLRELLGDPDHLLTMAGHARELGHPEAAQRVAELCLEAGR